MDLNKIETLREIKEFLEGYNNDLKYLVSVEVSNKNNYADCVIHEPGQKPVIKQIRYTPFLYMKDLRANNRMLYGSMRHIYMEKMRQYGISITKLETGNQKRLIDGFCWKVTSTKSFQSILDFFKDGGIDPYDKIKDSRGKIVKDENGEGKFTNRHLFFNVKPYEQFFISNKCRLFKGFEEYKDVHKATVDIETSGLRYERTRVFAIGIRDNRGFETILEVSKTNDDEAEIEVITNFFKTIVELSPAIISGYYSEDFDFDFILGRVEMLKMDLTTIQTTLNKKIGIKRRKNATLKHGGKTERYTATEIWGTSVIDIIHAVKKTAGVNSDIQELGLKYISKFENIAKPNRTYIKGDDNNIFNFYNENKIFISDSDNNYIEVPDKYQKTCKLLYKLQSNRDKVTEDMYKSMKKTYLHDDQDFVDWFKNNPEASGKSIFISGRKLLRQYLLDDLWETEKVDEVYNQSAFLLAKIVPTSYSRICTMGTAGIWNLLMTAWSYEKNIAIPDSDVLKKFPGGLVRCFKTGFSRRFVKIDYASLYPMLQMSNNIFPIFDITGGLQKMLLYSTTTRNIYKKLANRDKLNEEEVYILKEIDHDAYTKFIENKITDFDCAMYKVKQLPIKILNNSQYGAYGSNVAFNWSDNICAGRITSLGRLSLRQALMWFYDYGCIPNVAVTDGINFNIPEFSKIIIGENAPNTILDVEIKIEEAWKYGNKVGIDALIEKFNREEMKSNFMSVDNDGEFISCLNLAKINYATLSMVKDKKTGGFKEKVKLTGNTIKSKTMPDYAREFYDKGISMILHGDGVGFVDYYQSYVEDIFYQRIPLRKIATKNKVTRTISQYIKRGNDKNGKEKSIQAHMELLIEQRNALVLEYFEKHKSELILSKPEEEITLVEKYKLLADYLPPEPELDSIVYHVNSGYKKSDGASKRIIDRNTGLERFSSIVITSDDMKNNPDIRGHYNVAHYLDGFNKKVKSILGGFDSDIAKKIICKIVKSKDVDASGKKILVETLSKTSFTAEELELKCFDKDTIEESMYLEKSEVDFWNEYGYDPRLTWEGFKLPEDYPIYYEIYEKALEYLNEKMIELKKPPIKSINDKFEKNDLVLIKNDFNFSLAEFNGEYLKIIKEITTIPKTDIQIKIEAQRELEAENLKKILDPKRKKTDAEIKEEQKTKDRERKRKKYYKEFMISKSLNPKTPMSVLFEIENAIEEFDDYIDEREIFENEDVDPDLFTE